MNGNLVNSLLTVCGILNKQDVEYLIVGGTAVALHGYYRQSMNAAGVVAEKPDLDFWYNPTYSNYFRVLKTLEELGQDVNKFKQEQSPNPRKSFFKYEFEQFTLDLLPELRAPLKFGVSFNKREIITIREVDIPFISFDDLIVDKEANARPKDIMDIEELKRNRK
ncbi:nucleotidyl transferase AbiEii/AbiGii toxin family protein [Hymenobacter negativus]|uniref:Nucleotidyl transferase AbiEii/AbiGii toxin family protein n=1 Tax=Hymenobacter negativus TaxID=2795026 RepID=A0ABS3QG04_9BACT|nr:nucleotidyl transferase AbiEii/AbiGii toxin family protein [Hymenobacter negativus]MBO2010156.1 nucleotidyl transferase AbiEii/AbiGii toxin family protein [Hymenobacter negativus]